MATELQAAERNALAQRAYEDPVFFCRHFFPALFPTEMPWVHRGMLAILTKKCAFLEAYGDLDKILTNFIAKTDDGEEPIFYLDGDGRVCMRITRYTCVMLPRGFSKTTIAGIAAPLYDIVFEEHKFLVYTSETSTHASMQLNNIKRELESNEQLRLVFGDLVPQRGDAQSWSADFIETKRGVALQARGRGQQVRGLNHKGRRPSKIICDDLEDKESVATEAQRKKTKGWAYGDLMPALPEQDPDSTIIAFGTLLHKEALLNVWATDPDWTTVKFSAFDKQGEPLWPYLWSKKKIEAKKQSYARVGELGTFYLEFYNEDRPEERQLFHSNFIYDHPSDEQLYWAIYCDPAISPKRTADHAVISVNALNARGRIFTFESWGGIGVTPRQLIDQYFSFVRQYSIHFKGIAGCESNAYQAALIHLMQEEMARTGIWFNVAAVTHKTRKKDRIKGILQPRYHNGYIVHTRKFPALETQLLDFDPEKDQKDDYADAQAGCIALLDPYAGVVESETKTQTKSLDEELGDWRAY